MTITYSPATGTTLDQHGNPMSATTEAAALYDHVLDRLLRFDSAVLDLVGVLAEQAGDAPMSQAMLAYLTLSTTDTVDLPAARALLDTLRGMEKNERESMHTDAIAAWVDGDWTGAAKRLDDVLQQWPADLLALMLGHQLDFFLGDNLNLRDRPCRSLPAVDPRHSNAAIIKGMLAFGFEEAGSYRQAEDAGLEAIATNRDDVWAVHAVAHVLEMEGRVDEGIRFLVDRVADWGTGNMFAVHNWWHLGIYSLEAGRYDAALQIYDNEIHRTDSAGVPLEMIDASAMLWRFVLDGVDTGGRFDALAESWSTRVNAEPWYAFNDMHAVMALAGAGRLPEARAVIKRLDAYVGSASGTNASMTAEIGLPVSRALLAHAEGRYDDVVADLAPIRRTLFKAGGSHAQRDVLQRTLLDASIRVGDTSRARVLLNERLTQRPTSVFGWTQQARLFTALGDAPKAAAAEATAATHRTRFATPVLDPSAIMVAR